MVTQAIAGRSRWFSAACLGAVVLLGILSRRHPLPGFLAEYTGDALYSVAAFLALAWLAPRLSTRALVAAAFVGSASVEVSQLLAWPWLVELRSRTLGALLLGQGFQWADFLAYGVGAACAGLVDLGLAAARSGDFSNPLAPGPPRSR